MPQPALGWRLLSPHITYDKLEKIFISRQSALAILLGFRLARCIIHGMNDEELRNALEARIREKYEPIMEQIRAGDPSVAPMTEEEIATWISIDTSSLLPCVKELRVALGENGEFTLDQYRRAMAVMGLRQLEETAVWIKESSGDKITAVQAEYLEKHSEHRDQDQCDINSLMSSMCSEDEFKAIFLRVSKRMAELRYLI